MTGSRRSRPRGAAVAARPLAPRADPRERGVAAAPRSSLASAQNRDVPGTDIFGAPWFPDDPEFRPAASVFPDPAPDPTPGQLSFEGIA